jgi:polar amino acid transport system substrate-binding protein
MRRNHVFAIASTVAAALIVAGCGGDGSGNGDNAPPAGGTEEDAALAEMVPEDIASDGTLTVGTDATYAPNEFLAEDGTTIEGFDIDLFDAVAAKLGLEAEYTSAPFDNIIPSVQSGKYEIGVSSFTINAERMQVVDMVSYYSAGTSWAVKAGNPAGVTPDEACGTRVGVQRGTVQVEDITARSEQCQADGEPAITIDQFQGQDQVTAAVVSGKVDAELADSPIIAYAIKQTGDQLEQVGEIYDAAPYGYVVRQDQGQFADALSGAVNALIEDGTYQDVLDEWGVSDGAVTASEVNPSMP